MTNSCLGVALTPVVQLFAMPVVKCMWAYNEDVVGMLQCLTHTDMFTMLCKGQHTLKKNPYCLVCGHLQ